MKTRHVTLQQMYEEWICHPNNSHKVNAPTMSDIAKKYKVKYQCVIWHFSFIDYRSGQSQILDVIRSWS